MPIATRAGLSYPTHLGTTIKPTSSASQMGPVVTCFEGAGRSATKCERGRVSQRPQARITADSGWMASWLVNRFLRRDLPLMRGVRLRFAAHPVGYVFADHDAGEVDVRPRDGWHDRGIDDAQVGDGADPAVLVDHGHRIV
jgi:hypothetical protein